jgi:hypothetical protein
MKQVTGDKGFLDDSKRNINDISSARSFCDMVIQKLVDYYRTTQTRVYIAKAIGNVDENGYQRYELSLSNVVRNRIGSSFPEVAKTEIICKPVFTLIAAGFTGKNVMSEYWGYNSYYDVIPETRVCKPDMIGNTFHSHKYSPGVQTVDIDPMYPRNGERVIMIGSRNRWVVLGYYSVNSK